MTQKLLILGSTGSVGCSTLQVVAMHVDKFSVFALTANHNVELMLQQCMQFKPKIVVMADEGAAQKLTLALNENDLANIEVWQGAQALVDVSRLAEVDSVMSAIVGAAGLMPTLAAVRASKRVLIANKEPLVMTGALLMEEAKKANAVILPIDSEHNAIFQSMPDNQDKSGIRKIHLTASGGPFRGRAWSSLSTVTPEQACAHPNWSMGQKISVDSATMMNKGLELIEAVALFGLPVSQVEVVVHPQSIIHSMVEYKDGSFIAQLGAPDMRIPITHALSWPQRIESGAQTLDLCDIAQLDFSRPDLDNMPCLRLAQQAAAQGQSAPAILNAANEIAVDAFLQKKIAFTDIALVIDSVLNNSDITPFDSIEDILNIDNKARDKAKAAIQSL